MSATSAAAEASKEPPIRVLVVDDHGVVRRGLRSYLDMVDDIEVVGEAADGQEALDRLDALVAAGLTPAVVVMDLVMPRMDGITATEQLKRRQPDVEVVAMTSFAEVERVQAALKAGAAGYLLKDASADAVAAAVRAAHRGQAHLDPRVARRLAESLHPPTLGTVGSLTPREREVLGLVAEGLSNLAIAERLHISERTARTHVSNVLTKLGLASRTQAALLAIREGLGPADHGPTAPDTGHPSRRGSDA